MNTSLTEDESIFPESDIVFSTFWNRLGASLLDGFIIVLITLPVTYFNVTNWKIPTLFILSSLITIIYKPFLEYRYGATFGKMAVGIQVVGRDFEKVTLKEELRRVSFYLIPTILQQIFTLRIYFSAGFHPIDNYQDYNQFVVNSNPAILWLNGIVFILGTADCITFFTNSQRRSLHDFYAGTYVVDRFKRNSH